MLNLFLIGPVTIDTIVQKDSSHVLTGGSVYYMSKSLDLIMDNFGIFSKLHPDDHDHLSSLRCAHIFYGTSKKTCRFKNEYGNHIPDRIQSVMDSADPIVLSDVLAFDSTYFHLAPLLHSDIDPDVYQHFSDKGIVSVDGQGLLRAQRNQKIRYCPHEQLYDILNYIDILKLNQFELSILSNHQDLKDAIREIADYGINELVVTLGNKGAIIYENDTFINIPAFSSDTIIDTTGCGDCFMAGYLYGRSTGYDIEESGYYGSVLAGLNVRYFGARSINDQLLSHLVNEHKRVTSLK